AGLDVVGVTPVTGAKLLGGLAFAGLITILAWAHRIVPGLDARAAATAALVTGTSGVATRWSLSGMEVPLVMLLVAAALLVHMRSRALPDARGLDMLTGLLAALAMMTRPDTALVFAAMWLDRASLLLPGRGGRIAPLVRMSLPLLVFYAPYFAWRFDYYGWLLPNTFYVKVGSTTHQVVRGFEYVWEFLEVGWGFVAGAILAGAMARRLPRHAGLEALVGFLLLHLGYVVYVGGDVFWGHRFFAVTLGPLAILAGLATVHGLRRPALQAGAVAGMLAINLVNLALNRSLSHRGVVSEWGLEIGEWLGEHAPADALLATNIAGSIPWASGLATIDTLGLNDEVIAHTEMPRMGRGRAGHEKGNGEYVLSREPDYVIFASSRGARRPKFAGDRQLYRSDEFHDAYALRVYELESGLRLWLYVRRQSHGGKDLPVQPLVVGVNPFARGRLQLPGGEYEPDGSEGRE
ncbi:MAG: hypothetical protein VX000_01805, partial [Myxococcota bacterium]|nr:hypothetical protein [Myxococcota bacterium]